MKTFN